MPQMDTVLLQKVIEIAATSAEGSTAAATAMASLRAEVETARIETTNAISTNTTAINNLSGQFETLKAEMQNLKDQRQFEIDDKRAAREADQKARDGKLKFYIEMWNNSVGKVISPQTAIVLLGIFAAALGIRLSLPGQIEILPRNYQENAEERSVPNTVSAPQPRANGDMIGPEPNP